MTNDKLELTRRKILGSLGAVGVGGAAAGYGTSALYTDQEEFDDNILTAGVFDLKVDWEEHYSFPQVYGFGDPTAGLEVTRSEPASTSDYTPLPDPDSPLVWVHNDDLDAYMDNTAIEAYPDVDGDGVQDAFSSGEVGDFCTDGADVPTDLDPTAGFRTQNADTYDGQQGEPLVSLDDVKPGDFGELTLSLHLCDNAAYIWMQGDLVEAAENGIVGPEASSPDSGPADETVTELGQGDDIELLDEVQTTLWYDGDCDNVFDAGGSGGTTGQATDVVLVLDRSGSMVINEDDQGNTRLAKAKDGAKNLVNALGSNDQVSLVSFGDQPRLDEGLTTSHMDVINAIDGLSSESGVGTNMEGGIEQAHEELLGGVDVPDDSGNRVYSESGNARSDARKFIVFLGDGTPTESTDVTDSATNEDPSEEAGNAKADGAEVFSIAYGQGLDQDGLTTLEDIASDPASNPEDQYFFEANISEIETTFESIGGTVGSSGEQAFFRGTLREALTALSSGDGIPLDGDLGSSGRSCFPGKQTACIGLAWWVPTAVGNEIQSDSVAFDIGFYAEQCRNNDSPGDSSSGDETTDQSVTLEAFTSDSFIDGRITVGSGDDGDSLNGIVFDFPSGVDISNVGGGDVDVLLNGNSVTSDLDSVDGSDNGTTLTLGFGGSNALAAGDTIDVDINDVQFPGSGSVDVDVTVNGDGTTTTTMSI